MRRILLLPTLLVILCLSLSLPPHLLAQTSNTFCATDANCTYTGNITFTGTTTFTGSTNIGGGGGGGSYVLPTATNIVLGGVMPDGVSIINIAGAISVTPASIGAATLAAAATLTTNLAAESAARAAADITNANAIAAEAAIRALAVTNNTNAITTETARAEAAEAVLTVDIGSISTGGGGSSLTGTLYSDVQDDTSPAWAYCTGTSCAGGSNNATGHTAMTPSSAHLTATASEIGLTGTNANGLNYIKFGANDPATTFQLAQSVYVSTLTGLAALEYDMFQYVGGYKYQMGMQCDYSAGFWDVWNQSAGWVHTTYACNSSTFAAAANHTLVFNWTTTVNTLQYTPVSFIVDGTSNSLSAYGPYTATNVGFADNTGVDEQIDLNGTGGTVDEWIDLANFTVSTPGTSTFSGTKTAGSCTFTILNGLITAVSGC